MRWPPSSVSGGHTVTFSYPLMAEIISSFPPPQYITLSYSRLMKKPFTSNGALQYVQDWSDISSELKKKIKTDFSLRLCTKSKKEVLENDWAPHSHCLISHTEKLLPSSGFKRSSHSRLRFPIRYMQKRQEPEAPHSFTISKGKSHLTKWIHKLFSMQYITFSHQKKQIGKKMVFFFFGLPNQAYRVSEHRLVLVPVISISH